MNELVDTLLYEGYALYPYTPGATKNATPTPFGIVYPPAYAETLPSAYDHLELRCVVEGDDPEIECEVRFLAPSGERHRAEPQRAAGPGDFRFGELAVHVAITREGDEVCLRVENRTEAPAGLDRGEALRLSLISTHPLLTVKRGRFLSQLDAPCRSVNTWPVLASAADDVMLGAAIILPDHPQIAPESRGNLFDNTEIEEALVLHVQVLSDAERAEIERQDPAVREMIERAGAVTPDELRKLHGRMTLEPPQPSAAVRDPTARPARGRGRRRRLQARRPRDRPAGARRRPACAHARGAHGDRGADLPRLRRPHPPGRRARRARPGDPARDRALPVVLPTRAGGELMKRILVAGIGNAWLKDDGFGGEVVKRLEARELPPEAAVFDFATGGLDLAYELMRGYDALVLIDVSRQGGEPGTLYVMEAREEDVEAGIEDGQLINPHAMDPQTVLRFVKTLGAWPGKVVVIACEPAEVEDMGIGLTEQVERAVDGAVALVVETIEELRTDAAYASG